MLVHFGIVVVWELLAGAALVANFGGEFALGLLVDLVIPVVNSVEIGVGGGFARSLPGPLVGVGLRTEVLQDFVGNLPALSLLPFHVAALLTRIGVVVNREVY